MIQAHVIARVCDKLFDINKLPKDASGREISENIGPGSYRHCDILYCNQDNGKEASKTYRNV
jgi:hypothetical protein